MIGSRNLEETFHHSMHLSGRSYAPVNGEPSWVASAGI